MLAREVGDAAITSHALTNIGTARWFLGDPAGQRIIEEALQVALDAGDTEDACRAYVNITWTLLDWFRLGARRRTRRAHRIRRLTAPATLAGFNLVYQARR